MQTNPVGGITIDLFVNPLFRVSAHKPIPSLRPGHLHVTVHPLALSPEAAARRLELGLQQGTFHGRVKVGDEVVSVLVQLPPGTESWERIVTAACSVAAALDRNP